MSRPDLHDDFDAGPPAFPPRARRLDARGDRNGPGLLLLVLGCVVGAAVVWAGSGLVKTFRGAPAANDPAAAERATLPKSDPDAEEAESIRVFKAARESVVNVDTVVRVRRFDLGVQEQQTGTGSGFVWDDAGRVVTNYHVVKSAAEGKTGLRVVFADRTAYEARLVGIAPDQDLAVVQVTAALPADRLRKIAVGRSADLEVGQKVYAIGNPFGLSLTMTKGIISALEREITSPTGRTISGAIQTDAPINPGNSGGPLLDKDGRLVGVNTSIATAPGGGGGNVGIGFAIPVDTVNPVVTEIVRNGRVARADLGVRLVDQSLVRRAGFAAGAMVGQVDPAGPAAAAGIKGVTGGEAGDLITAVDGEPVKGAADLARMIARRKPGDAVKLAVTRGEEQVEVAVTLRGV